MNSKWDSVRRWPIWNVFLKTEQAVIFVTSVLAAGIVATGVFMRYVLKTDLFGQEEIINVVAMWLYWIGGVYGSRLDNHIQGDIVGTFVKSAKVRKAIRVLVLVITLMVLAVFTKWSIDYVVWSYESGARSTGLKIPMILGHLPLALGFGLMLVHTVYHLSIALMSKTDEPNPSAMEVAL